MKRLIYSIFTEDISEHPSCSDYKRNQFKKYRKQIEDSHRTYAEKCGADYRLIFTSIRDYNVIQLEKLMMLEDFINIYDEVLYIDFDVIPKTDVSFFKSFNLNKLCFHAINPKMIEAISKAYEVDARVEDVMRAYDEMNPYIKMCAKNAMLLLDDITGKDIIINTGVVGGNKESISQLKFKERKNMLDDILEEAKEDSLYPENMTSKFFQNNETYMSYLVERYDIPYTEIGVQWNYTLHREEEIYPHDNNHFLHNIGKHFHCCFNSSS